MSEPDSKPQAGPAPKAPGAAISEQNLYDSLVTRLSADLAAATQTKDLREALRTLKSFVRISQKPGYGTRTPTASELLIQKMETHYLLRQWPEAVQGATNALDSLEPATQISQVMRIFRCGILVGIGQGGMDNLRNAEEYMFKLFMLAYVRVPDEQQTYTPDGRVVYTPEEQVIRNELQCLSGILAAAGGDYLKAVGIKKELPRDYEPASPMLEEQRQMWRDISIHGRSWERDLDFLPALD